jgi:hypothetical protein
MLSIAQLLENISTPRWPHRSTQGELYCPAPTSDTEALEKDDLDATLERPKTIQLTYYSLGIIIAGTILVSVAAVYLTLYQLSTRYAGQHSSVTTDCGTSATTANERGCHFDLMSFSWLPRECYDASLEKSFMDYHPERLWKWYLDPEGKHELSQQDVQDGTHDFLFVSWEYHLVHCAYMWRKLHRAIEIGGIVDSYVGNYNHTMHCSEKLLVDGVDRQERNTIIQIKYPECKAK